MHNYDDIISKLTLSQKIRMLTHAGDLTGKDMKILGIPEIKAGDMKDYGRELFPNATALINSWNEDVWYEVASAKANMLDADGKNFVIAPGPKLKISPYRREICEDPCLAARFSSLHQRAAADIGMTVAPSGFYITKSDVEWLDESPSDRIVHEFITAPYINAMPNEHSKAIIIDERETNDNYKDVPRALEDEIEEYADFLICKQATDENTVDFISRKIICLEGSEIALESAVARYKKLYNSIENNEGATKELLNDEILRRAAISPETVDEAVEKLFEFIYTVRRESLPKKTDLEEISALALKATEQSAVLLKNREQLLPLEKHRKVGIIGDIAFREFDGETVADRLTRELSSRGYTVVGAARGYDMQTVYSDKLVREAIDLVASCDTVIFMLGFGYEAEKLIPKTETLSLPANQISLCRRILHDNKMNGKKTVALISSGHAPDVAFTRDVDALMLMPLEVSSSAEAAARLLAGDTNPSGKLAYTLYSDSDAAFGKAKNYKNQHKVKSGPFIGYRYYDTAELTVGYPFGHGLSYSKFRYSGLSVKGGKATFSVENVSGESGVEVAQIYAGLERSSIINPKKELCAFTRIELLAGEKKTVTVPFDLPKKYIDKEFVVPGGSYAIYVGSSVSDVRLKTFIRDSGPAVADDGERPCDYLQSVSNVKEDNYTLEASYRVMKKSIRNIVFGIIFVALAISAVVFNVTTKHPSTFIGVFAGVLSAVALAFFISEAVARGRIYAAERRRINQLNEEKFESAEEIPALSTAQMFSDEFETHAIEKESVADIAEDTADSIFNEYVDTDFTFNTAVSEFRSFLGSRGFRLADSVAESFMSSLATSGLIITSGMDSERFAGFVRVVCEYFGVETFVDKAEKKSSNDNLFFKFDYHGDSVKKNVLLALDYARENPSKLTIAALDGADEQMLKEYVTPFTRYLYSPKANNKISVGEDVNAETSYNISANLKLFINLSKYTSLDTLPAHIASLAAVNTVSFDKCIPNESFAIAHELNRYQLEYMRDKECANADIAEDVWKKIDKIEKYAKKFSDYRIGNKAWLSFEKHIAMLLCSGMVVAEALDLAVACRLVASLSVSLKDAIPEDEQTLADCIEFVLGEGNADVSKKTIERMVTLGENVVINTVYEAAAESAPSYQTITAEAPVAETPNEEPAASETNGEEAPAEQVSESEASEYEADAQESETVEDEPIAEEATEALTVEDEPIAEEATEALTVEDEAIIEETAAEESPNEEAPSNEESDEQSNQNNW